MLLASQAIQQSSLGTAESFFVSIVAGLVVVFIPFIVKYFNSKFESLKSTAEEAAITARRVDKHHESNKKRFKKMNKKINLILSQQTIANGE